MSRLARTVLVVIAGWHGGVTLAEAAPYALPEEIDQAKICREGAISRGALYAHLFDNAGISRECESAAGGAADLLRLDGVEARYPKACLDNKEQLRIDRARNLIFAILRRTDGDEYFVSSLASRIKAEDKNIMWATEEFTKKGSEVSVACMKAEGRRPKDKSPGNSKPTAGDWQLRLRLDQNSLEYGKSQASQYKKAKSAKLAFSNDGVKGETKYEISGAVGLASPTIKDCVLGASCMFIPYIKRELTVTAPKAGRNDLDRTSYGALGVIAWTPTTWFSAITTFDTQYIVDRGTSGEAHLWGETLRWRPSIEIGDMAFPGRYIGLFNDAIFVGYEYGLLMRYAHTLEDGGNQLFQKQKSFLYYGPEFNLLLYGTKGKALEGVKLMLHYNWLYGDRGTFGSASYFSTELSYALDKEGDVDISLTYQRGREYEGFDERELLKAAIGYKF